MKALKSATAEQMAELRRIIITSEHGTELAKKFLLCLLKSSDNLKNEFVFQVFASEEKRHEIFDIFSLIGGELHPYLRDIKNDLRLFNKNFEFFALLHKDRVAPTGKGLEGTEFIIPPITVVLESFDLTINDIEAITLEL